MERRHFHNPPFSQCKQSSMSVDSDQIVTIPRQINSRTSGKTLDNTQTLSIQWLIHFRQKRFGSKPHNSQHFWLTYFFIEFPAFLEPSGCSTPKKYPCLFYRQSSLLTFFLKLIGMFPYGKNTLPQTVILHLQC